MAKHMGTPARLSAMVIRPGLKGLVKNPQNNKGLYLFNYLVSQLVSIMLKKRKETTTYSSGPHYEMSLL